MAEKPLRIIILGGGSAGWMAANLLANRWPGRAEVTVIESTEIGPIGVGEGSTPYMIDFFRQLGIAEADWMPRCKATFKNGIRFKGWSTRTGFESYFHPFRTELDRYTTQTFFTNTLKRRQGQDVHAHPDRFSLLTHLAANRLAPRSPANFPFKLLYGYHFDANLLGLFLRDHAVGLGVRHLDRKIVKVAVDEKGEVTHLAAEDGEEIAGDLFIDASGFRSVIAQEALGVKFISFEKNLFNDSAIVCPSEHEPSHTDSQTGATALKCGWVFKIPLTHRFGNGYVYSSRYCSQEEAEKEFRAHLGITEETEVKYLKMKVGKVATAWTGNCVAIGLSQSFIEPLEATALMVVQKSVTRFIELFELGGFTPKHRAAYNRFMNNLSEGVRDYIVCHYKVNGRDDTLFWRDNAAHNNLSNTLGTILTGWFAGEDIMKHISETRSLWGDLPWHCLLAGYGCFPSDDALKPVSGRNNLARIDQFIEGCGLNFPDHRQLLAEQAG